MKAQKCSECGAELRLRPASCPLCGADVKQWDASAPALNEEDYRSNVRELREELRKLREGEAEAV